MITPNMKLNGIESKAGIGKENVKHAKRPIGLTLISILLLLTALRYLIFYREFVSLSINYGYALTTTIYSLLVIILFSFGAGVNILLGRKAGWWFGTIYYAYALLLDIKFLIYPEMAAGWGNKYHINFIFILLTHLLLIAYFFRENVLYYFNHVKLSKIKALLIIESIALCLILLWFVILVLS